ncbi:MAG: hypothetical protein P1U57_09160 [Oleibacter sp.]|nr:hypothetical protein [Thalassolituus sp.]
MNMKLPVVLGVGVLVAIGGYFYVQPNVSIDSVLATNSPSSSTSYKAETYTVDELAEMSPDKLMDMQKQSFDAVIAAADNANEFDQYKERPEFISPVEWMMLNSVADQNPDPQAELTRLVNLVRFNKQIELLDNVTEQEQRVVLTEAILNQLPKRIENQEMSIEKAQSVQLKVIENLYSDPQKVRERAAQEAERIGAKFDIEQS